MDFSPKITKIFSLDYKLSEIHKKLNKEEKI